MNKNTIVDEGLVSYLRKYRPNVVWERRATFPYYDKGIPDDADLKRFISIVASDLKLKIRLYKYKSN